MNTSATTGWRSIAVQCSLVVVGLTALGAAWAHGPHAHGKGELELTIQGSAIRGAFRTPMDSLLGFEHLPKTEAQRNAVDQLRQRLANPSAVVAPNPEARCTPRMSEATSSMFTGAAKGEHSDLEYRFSFECGAPEQLKALELSALKEFKRLSEVRVQLVTARGQRAMTLKKKDPRLLISN